MACRKKKPAPARSDRFWEKKRLADVTPEEWEALCDGCGMCCAHKLEDEETGEVLSTNLACPLLNLETCRCSDYKRRHDRIPECIKLTPQNIRGLCRSLPPSCAYRRRARGQALPDWHPLVTGNPRSTEHAGMSARNRLLRLEHLDDLREFVVGTMR